MVAPLVSHYGTPASGFINTNDRAETRKNHTQRRNFGIWRRVREREIRRIHANLTCRRPASAPVRDVPVTTGCEKTQRTSMDGFFGPNILRRIVGQRSSSSAIRSTSHTHPPRFDRCQDCPTGRGRSLLLTVTDFNAQQINCRSCVRSCGLPCALQTCEMRRLAREILRIAIPLVTHFTRLRKLSSVSVDHCAIGSTSPASDEMA